MYGRPRRISMVWVPTQGKKQYIRIEGKKEKPLGKKSGG